MRAGPELIDETLQGEGVCTALVRAATVAESVSAGVKDTLSSLGGFSSSSWWPPRSTDAGGGGGVAGEASDDQASAAST